MSIPVLSSASIGLQSLQGNPLRSVLSTLGIIMGVGSMVSVLALGDGVEAFARNQIVTTSSLQIVTISPLTTELVDGQRFAMDTIVTFEPADAVAIAGAVGDLGDVVLMISGAARFQDHTSGQIRAVRILGVNNIPQNVSAPLLLAGANLSPADLEADGTEVLVTKPFAESLFPGEDTGRAVGTEIEWDGIVTRIVGIIDPAQVTPHSAVMGFRAARSVLASTNPVRPQILLTAPTIEAVTPLKARAEAWLTTRYEDWTSKVSVATSAARVAQAQQAMTVFKILMTALTSVSLVVGGVGVMNILLASVAERTREIGVRRAVGARRKDLLTQFLAESIAITSMGAVLGIVLGLGVAWVAAAVIRMQTQAAVIPTLTWQTFVFAVAASVTVGLCFGTYPALQAARLSPTDAIRRD
jgi:putative ABC transport system permease protein